jgi:serine/threonine protein phosphatase 1
MSLGADSPIREDGAPAAPPGGHVRTYAIGDVHGCLEELEKAWTWIKKDAGDRPHRIVMLGDYVDRGPDSKGVIDFLIKNLGPDDVALKGNHEDMFLSNLDMVNKNPSVATPGFGVFFHDPACAKSYGFTSMADTIPDDHMRFLKYLKLSYDDGHRFFCHAGVDPTIPLDQQKEADLLWSRLTRETYMKFNLERFIVHGHTPGPVTFTPSSRSINLDGGLVFGGVLGVAVWTDEWRCPGVVARFAAKRDYTMHRGVPPWA